MAYANGLYTSRDYQQAETAFRKATTLAPKDAQGWNNLAYVLLKTACPRQARQAAACAASLAPGIANYRNTVAEINTLANGNDGPHCRPVDCKSAINTLKLNGHHK
jgi:Flp pilus assembly protein TadD